MHQVDGVKEKMISFLCVIPDRPKAPTQVRPSFGITRPIPSPSYPIPSPQQQHQISQQTQSTAKLKKEKKKPLVPFHHRPSISKDRPEAVKSHVGAMTKGLPTANSLTSVTQMRHSDVALAHNAKNTTGAVAHKNSTLDTKTNAKASQHSSSLLRVNSSRLPSSTCEKVSEMLVKSEESCANNFVSNIDSDKKDDDEQSCYVLPVESVFSVPVLPSDPLDCRPLGALGDQVITDEVFSPSPLDAPMSLWER